MEIGKKETDTETENICRFIYILDSSITFWTSKFSSTSRSNKPVSESVTQKAVELINNALYCISVQQKR